jgi:hypothetical protein
VEGIVMDVGVKKKIVMEQEAQQEERSKQK